MIACATTRKEASDLGNEPLSAWQNPWGPLALHPTPPWILVRRSPDNGYCTFNLLQLNLQVKLYGGVVTYNRTISITDKILGPPLTHSHTPAVHDSPW